MKHHRFLEFVCIGAIIVLAFGVRLYRINAPIADWHSWRQVDTAAVARNFSRFGFDITRPRYDDLSNIQSGKDNPQGWRMVEFPLYQAVAFGLMRAFGGFSIEVWLRLVNISAASASVFLLWVLLRRLYNPFSAMLSALVYAILPYAVYYGRVILPDTFMVFWGLLTLVTLTAGKKDSLWWTFFAGVFGAVSLLAKPMAIFLIAPAYYLLYKRYGFSPKAGLHAVVFSLVAALPLYLWRQWIVQFPEGIASSEWLLNNNNIRLKGAWFYWLFDKRLGELMLGLWGLVPFGFGLVSSSGKKDRHFGLVWVASGLLYLVIFAAGNVQHDYYQILLLPIIASTVGHGIASLIGSSPGRLARSLLALVCVLFMTAFSWYTIRTFYWINRPEIVEAGQHADRILPKNAKVIAPYNGDTTFLYQTNRQGWPLGFDIDQKIEMGATHYVTVSPGDNDGETRALASRFTVLVRNERFAIIDLTRPNETVQ